MSDTEINDLENHLSRKISVAVADVMQLMDDPRDQAKVLSTAVVIMFMAAVDLIGDLYENDTGKKANPAGILYMLAKECVERTKAQRQHEIRASKPRKRPARSS